MASLPDDVPGYRIVRVLGQGGMATVYLAMQESLGREVALKLLSERFAQDPEAASRFVRVSRSVRSTIGRGLSSARRILAVTAEGGSSNRSFFAAG